MSAFSIDDKDNISNYRVTQASHGFSKGEFLRLNGSTYQKAQADNETNAEVVGMVSEVIDVNTFKLRVIGRQIELSGLTAGAVYYLSDTVAGGITSTEPNLSKPVLLADSSTSGILLTYRGVTDAGGGGGTLAMELITATELTGAVSSVTFTDLDNTYHSYEIRLDAEVATDNSNMIIRTSSNNGVSYDSGASDYSASIFSNTSTQTYNSRSNILINSNGIGNAANEGISARFSLINPASTDYTRLIGQANYTAHTPNNVTNNFGGTRNSTSPVDAIQISMTSGNIAAGTFKLYGIK